MTTQEQGRITSGIYFALYQAKRGMALDEALDMAFPDADLRRRGEELVEEALTKMTAAVLLEAAAQLSYYGRK